MNVYVAQYATLDDLEAEADDQSKDAELDVPQFEAVFADWGPAELRTMQEKCIADYNAFCEDDTETLRVEDVKWTDGAWMTPPVGRRYTRFRGDHGGDHLFFITVQEVALQ